VITPTPLPQEGVNLVDEDDGRLQLLGEREESGDKLVGFAEPVGGRERWEKVGRDG
jgi:hypothetical protein